MPYDVSMKDYGTSQSAFGELVTVPYCSLTGWSFTYNINSGIVKQETIDTGIITTDLGHAVLTTGSSPTGMAEITTVRASRYIPAIGGVATFTAVFDKPQENSKQVIGIINTSDGWAFGYNGLDFGILRKANNVEYWIPQSTWSENKRPDLDHTKGNVYQIKYQWLGYGEQVFSIENRETGKLEIVHRIKYVNEKTETSVLNPNLPMSAYVVNFGNTIPITLKTPSANAGLHGDGFNDSLSVNLGQDSLKTVTAGTTPILAFRLSEIYQGKANRLFSQVLRATFATDTNKSVIFRAYAGGTVIGGTWGYLSEELSPLEYNKTMTGYTTGLLVGTFPMSKLDSYEVDIGTSSFRMYAGQQLVIVADTAGIGDVVCGVNWKSFV